MRLCGPFAYPLPVAASLRPRCPASAISMGACTRRLPLRLPRVEKADALA